MKCKSDLAHFYLAFEDLAASQWDRDFNDFVVQLESVSPVPEPAALALFGFGLAAIARRRAVRR